MKQLPRLDDAEKLAQARGKKQQKAVSNWFLTGIWHVGT